MTLKNYKPLICSRCNSTRIKLVKCERDECDFEDYRDAIVNHFQAGPPPKYFCTLTGGVNAGKTYYLISLLHSLMEDKGTKRLLRKYGIAKIFMIDPISKRTFRKLKNECERGMLALTDPDPKTLSFFNVFISLTNGSVAEIVLFNTSGEKIEDYFLDNDARIKAHELQGAATLHFVDPREDTMLNNILENPKDASYGPCKDYKIVDFLHKVLQIMNRGTTIVNNPVAVCISKFDLLLSRIPFDIPENPFIELHSKNLFKDIDVNSRNLYQFLYEKSETIQPEELEDSFNNIRYFAVAPYGSDHTPALWNKRTPYGVEAPFIWLLKELEILPKQNGFNGKF